MKTVSEQNHTQTAPAETHDGEVRMPGSSGPEAQNCTPASHSPGNLGRSADAGVNAGASHLPDDSGRLAWTSHPLAQQPPLKTASLLACIAAATFAAWYGLDGAVYGAVTLAVLVASVSRYLLPTHFALTDEGVSSSHLFRSQLRQWSEFRRVDRHGDGLFLSPFINRSRLDSFRGIFLPCAGDISLRDEATAIAVARIGA